MKRIVLAVAWIVTALPIARAMAADIPAIADTNTDAAAPTTNFGLDGNLQTRPASCTSP